ncbi:DUF2807 domain-containing protein [Caballeronia sp. EK]|uniref:GIN domain-containing protein n=1 Tax=Caballeronia sp. EK TaxID=2767469 RepID=UPI00165653B7|nr:DUF2807 domain-containing protein [Caballeronia sp. EK]MBC8642034.1 DUF2807 domain-containing protein [Caballeronia sp. EK]
MKKEEFLRQIRSARPDLTPSEIEKILDDYRPHFNESTACGHTEEATAAALSDPVSLGDEHVVDRRHEDRGLLNAVKRLFDTRRRRQSSDESRELTWISGSHMKISLPVKVSWRPANRAKAILKGPAWLIDHVRLDSRQLHGRFKWRLFHNNHLRVDLESPAIEAWSVHGGAELRLLNLSQSALELESDSSGDILAAGRVQHVRASVLGSGDIDLSSLDHLSAAIRVVGSGDVILAPSEEADLSAEGSGDIKLLSSPPCIKTHISGSGHIRMSNRDIFSN